MSMHKEKLTKQEVEGLLAHGLPVGKPSQLSDSFILGMRFEQSLSQPTTNGVMNMSELKKVQITFSCIGQHFSEGISRHAQDVMRDLGIKYEHATPQSIADCWWFWNCTNVPSDLPSFVRIVERNPMNCVGNGINMETAIKLTKSLKGE